ncbi:hypothetical protein LTR56_016190 [Elasticomyces elasticus]|nr:hypothetical protein LTR56_016190 [Elasticomyces elasticus]KAK3642149.1 hypothetical protein LTR22_016270 [Elasticomyces elasticus]KAK4914197.1 hypothetical protein LTR49_017550 [Elasticomyces elasticus]KAK5762558.1 hypothetical protein LTS12_007349 [Elasticomyces elasticus]
MASSATEQGSLVQSEPLVDEGDEQTRLPGSVIDLPDRSTTQDKSAPSAVNENRAQSDGDTPDPAVVNEDPTLSESDTPDTSAVQATGTGDTLRSDRVLPAVCDECQQLRLNFCNFVVDGSNLGMASSGPSFHGKRLMGTYDDIHQRSNRTGCELCQLLLRSLVNKPIITSICPTLAKCRLSWVLDGRATPAMIKRTRRLAIEWKVMAEICEPSYIVLVAPYGKGPCPRDAGQSSFFLGRKLAFLEVANTQLVEKWLDLCRECHSDCSIDRASQAFHYFQSQTCFKVLDVKRMRLCRLLEDSKYTALSYTWGPPDKATASKRFKVTDSNIRDLEIENGVAGVLRFLPLAIWNAIALTRRLGIDYIWIDSLCIIQGNTESWNANARLMDSIYGYAELTICAADDNGADAGLQALYASDEVYPDGFAPGAEHQAIARYASPGADEPILELILSRPSDVHIAASRWNTRAWTFQERMLSPRCLICVNKRMYFQCKTGTFCEDTCSDSRSLRLASDPVNVYKDCIQMYTSRQLSHESDALFAFDGIGKVLCRGLACIELHEPAATAQSTLLFGLPTSHFDYALLWQPNGCLRRRCTDLAQLPSWSWSGWETERGTSYGRAAVEGPEINLHEWLMEHTWITYYTRDNSGHLRLVWDPLIFGQRRERQDRWKGYDTLGSGWPSSSQESPTVDLHGRPWSKRMPSHGRLHERGTGERPQDVQFDLRLPAFRNKPRLPPPGTKKTQDLDMPFLQFYTWWGRFYLSALEEKDSLSDMSRAYREPTDWHSKRYGILDRDHDFAGVIVLDRAWAADHRPIEEPQEFIAISDARSIDKGECGSWGSLGDEGEDVDTPWQFYNVLMLVRDDSNNKSHEGNSVAYRRGLGKMYKQAFERACRNEDGTFPSESQWKEILLG